MAMSSPVLSSPIMGSFIVGGSGDGRRGRDFFFQCSITGADLLSMYPERLPYLKTVMTHGTLYSLVTSNPLSDRHTRCQGMDQRRVLTYGAVTSLLIIS